MCNNSNIQFIVLGISPQPMSIQGNIICEKLNNYLKIECTKHKINYIDNFAEMNNYRNFLSDKLHLSINGHRKLGEILLEEIKTPCNN
jgi:lysophospholipase L1-like esterase